MKKLVTILLGSSLLLSSFFFLTPTWRSPKSRNLDRAEQLNEHEPEYSSLFSTSQEQLQLDHEYIQYRITFHENTSVNITMNITHVMLDFEPVCYRIYLTNGSGFVTNKSFIHDTQLLAGIFTDISLAGHRLILGGRHFINRIPYGLMQTRTINTTAQQNETWYLTIIVLRKKCETITFTATAPTPCMEIHQITRDHRLGFYSAWDGDFDGHYIGLKLIPLTPFGISLATIHKVITTTTGTLFEFVSAFHAYGRLTVITPTHTTLTQTNPHLCIATAFTTTTGKWHFSTQAIGFPYKHLVYLFYADLDLHLKNQIPPPPDIHPIQWRDGHIL